MRAVSTGFIEASLSPIGYATAYVMIGATRVDASDLTDITITENLGGGAFTIGSLDTTEVSITVVSDAISGVDLTQPIQIYLGYLVEDDYEYVPMGIFYAEPRDISHKNLLTVIRARDKSWTLTSPYSTALDFSGSVYVNQVLAEIQTDLGLVYGTYGGLNPAYVRVYEAPEGSYRDVLAQMALLLGTSAKFNRTGALDFIKPNPSATPVESYGAFDYASADYVLTSDEPMGIGKLTVNYSYMDGDEEVTDTFVYSTTGSHGVTIDTTNIRTQAETDTLGQEVLGSGVAYYGYSVVLPGQPQLDLADVISLTEPLGDQYNFIVLSMVHTFNGAMKSTLSAQIEMEDPQIDGQNISGSIKETVKAQGSRLNVVEQIAGNTNQYFWHTESGTDTGAHITEVPKDEFIANPSQGGGNLLARSNGIAVRDGLDELATFGASGTQIGKDTESHIDITPSSIQMKTDYNLLAFTINERLYFEDEDYAQGSVDVVNRRTCEIPDDYVIKRDSIITAEWQGEEVSFTYGEPQTLESGGVSFEYDGDKKFTASSNTPSARMLFVYFTRVHIDNQFICGETFADDIAGKNVFVFSPDGDAIMQGDSSGVFGDATVYASHSFAFNKSYAGDNLARDGKYLFTCNSGHARNGYGSFACNYGKVDATFSFVAGWNTLSENNYQCVIGKCNKNKSSNVFEIGNGTDTVDRNNALEVTWEGDVHFALDTTAQSGDDYDLYSAITSLGWENDVIV